MLQLCCTVKKSRKNVLNQAKKIFSDNSDDEGLPIIKVNKNDFKNKSLSDLIQFTKLRKFKERNKKT